jgi:putative ABC transport system permease protein
VIRSAFLSFYRSLTRHPLYAGLNLLGLSFGIAVFIVLSLFVRFETSYEQWLPNADRIYELVHWNRARPQQYFAFPGYGLDAIRAGNPGIKAVRLIPAYPVIKLGNVVVEEEGQLIDPGFFDIFDLPVLAGNRQALFASPDGVILSERMARKYFGRTDVVGATLDMRDDVVGYRQPGKSGLWRIVAVTKDLPQNTTLKFDVVRGLPAFRARVGTPYVWYSWGAPQNGRTFIEATSDEVAKQLPARSWPAIAAFPIPFSEVVRARIRASVAIGIARFVDVHLSDPHRAQAVSALRLTAWLSLAVALVNYVNLATARSGLRLRETSLRSVHGASARWIGGQLVMEAVLAGGASLVIGFSLVEAGIPVLNRIANLSLSLDYRRDWLSILGLSSAVLIGALSAGAYPAGILALNRSVRVFGAATAPRSNLHGRRLREALTVVQFATAGIFLIVIAGFGAQIRHMETSELGYSRDNLLVTNALVTSDARRDQMRRIVNAWRDLPGIDGVASGQAPGLYYMTPHYLVGRSDRAGAVLDAAWTEVSPDFFKVYRTPVLAGRTVDERDDIARTHGRVPVEEDMAGGMTVNIDADLTAVKMLGFKSPEAALGQNLRHESSTLHIVGVVADQRFQAPTRKNPPSLYISNSDAVLQWETVVRYSGIDEATARQRLDTVWRKHAPDLPFDVQSIRQKLDYYYHDDRRNTELFAIGGGVAALIGAVGLFGMAAFSTSARVHEIGIRKASGATRRHIVRLLMFQFLRPVLIANLIAWPVAYVVLDGWLKQFDDRVAMSLWFFLAGSGLSLLIAAVTVVGVAVSAASLSPARALRQL